MVEIKPASTAQLAIVQQIAYQTWPDTFADILSPGQISFMLERMYSRAALDEQTGPQGHVFLLAQTGADYVGYVSYALHYQQQPVTKVHKLYVLPRTQGQGVGAALLNAVAEVARQHNNDALSLNVNRFNRAVRFYERLGFEVVGQEDIDIGGGYLMEDYVMVKRI